MKHPLNFAAIILSLLIMAACSRSTPEQERLRESISETDRTCPIHIADGISIDAVKYEDNVVTYYATVNTPMIPLKVLHKQMSEVKPMLLQMLRASDDSKVSQEMSMCVDADASIRYVITDGNDELTIDITKEELQNACK